MLNRIWVWFFFQRNRLLVLVVAVLVKLDFSWPAGGLVEVDFDGEELGVSCHDLLALAVKQAESGHQTLQLVDDVLDVLGIQQLQLGQDVGPEAGKLLLGVRPGERDFGLNSRVGQLLKDRFPCH